MRSLLTATKFSIFLTIAAVLGCQPQSGGSPGPSAGGSGAGTGGSKATGGSTGGRGGAGGSGGSATGTGGSGGSAPATGGSGGSGGSGGGGGSGAGTGGGGYSGSTGSGGSAATDARPADTGGPGAEVGPGAPGEDDPACARMVPVAGADALAPALAAAMPGDCLVAADGAYGALTLKAKGTAAAPIQLRAANLLKATATTLRLETAEHFIVRGFALANITFVNTKYARVTRCQVRGPGAAGYWVRVEEQKGCSSGCNNDPPGTSDHARVDHCDIGGGSADKDVFNPTAFATNTRIDHNYIHDTSGDHLMTLGCCGPKYDYFESGTIVEQNLFVNANGTSAEMISIKGANVHFRYNTIRAHRGDIDIRAGKNNHIYGNYILGPGPGLRMYEDNHRIYNNYVVGGLSGNQSGPIHAPVKNATVVFNTFTGSINLAGGSGNVSANNLLIGGGSGGMGNMGGAGAALGLEQKDGIWTLTAGSKAIGAAVGSYPFVMDDIGGIPRGAKLDVGAQQFSTSMPSRRPLTTADVGPMAP